MCFLINLVVFCACTRYESFYFHRSCVVGYPKCFAMFILASENTEVVRYKNRLFDSQWSQVGLDVLAFLWLEVAAWSSCPLFDSQWGQVGLDVLASLRLEVAAWSSCPLFDSQWGQVGLDVLASLRLEVAAWSSCPLFDSQWGQQGSHFSGISLISGKSEVPCQGNSHSFSEKDM